MKKENPLSEHKPSVVTFDLEQTVSALHVISIAVSKIGEVLASQSINGDPVIFKVLAEARRLHAEITAVREQLMTESEK